MPCEVSQSQISVPCLVTTTARKPPPGNTMTPTPVFFPLGGKTVRVGRETSHAASEVVPWSASGVRAISMRSGAGTPGFMSGAAPGHTGICFNPSGGCQGPGAQVLSSVARGVALAAVDAPCGA